MKKINYDQLYWELKLLRDQGEIVIGKIRVNDGKNIYSYTSLSACPPEHREGYRRALETCRDTYIRDVVYDPMFVAKENATSIATLE